MSLLTFSKENLHHTNICIGPKDKIKNDIEQYISSILESVSKVEHLSYEYDKFLVKDAEHIFQTHLHKTSKDELQIITIFFNSTNIETQNKILKMLEEPRPQTYFFICVPTIKNILQTILSRGHVFKFKKEILIDKETEDFILGSYPYRLDFVKNLLEDIKKERKTKQDVLDFLEKIEKYVHDKQEISKLKRILAIKSYIQDQGVSLKQQLEYLVVTI
jgi:DNA polymerase III delta prime subunit